MGIQEAWLIIPIVAIIAGTSSRVIKTWLKIRAQQQALGVSNQELEREVAEIRKERVSLLERLENLEAIVVSQTWDAIQDHSLPPAEKEHRVTSTVRRELAPSAPSYQQRAEQLARRLQG